MESQAETEYRLLHGSSFGAVATAYADLRPTYADDAIRFAMGPAGTTPPRVADVGAGTGILTAALVRLGADVTAVEPDPQMLAELRRRVRGVRSENGSAEALPFPDASLDAVVAGQAMHWFDLDRALPEIARVLVPGGVFAGLWNVDDDRVPWVAEMVELYRREAASTHNTVLSWRAGAGQVRAERIAEAGAGLFTPAEFGEFGNGQQRTADSLLASIATHSHLLVMDDVTRTEVLDRVGDFLHSRAETATGEFTLPLVTVVLRIRRLPTPPA
jgi:SAM-dependent methyltransferase